MKKTYAIVIRKGKNFNLTLAGILFDKFGTKIEHDIVVCEDWITGFQTVKNKQYQCALFVDSGTVITDWNKFAELLANYPHQGLVAHLIWHQDKNLRLDQQCWYMELDSFELDDLLPSRVQHPMPLRSQKNIHDDYTPLWVRPDPSTEVEYEVDGFGQGLIAKQLASLRSIVNWNHTFRDFKFFCYADQQLDMLDKFKDYIKLSENQFWVLNNEPIVPVNQTKLLMPGSGLAWVLNMIQPVVSQIQIVDISSTQIEFCHKLWHEWNGSDYGSFCWHFIKHKQLVNYELDRANLSPIQRLKLNSKSAFVDYVNRYFDSVMPADFPEQWNSARNSKQLFLTQDNIVTWTLQNDIEQYDAIWLSNILDYKWTMLHSTMEQCNQLRKKLQDHATRNQ